MKTTSFILLSACVLAGAMVGGSACSGSVIQILQSDASANTPGGGGPNGGGDASTGADGSTGGDGGGGSDTCTPKGGKCLAAGTSAPPTYRKAGPGEGSCLGTDACWLPVTAPVTACAIDPDCNNNPAVSSIWGKCFQGICVCRTGFYVQPNGKCDTKLPPDCTVQQGTCHQNATSCPNGLLEGGQNVDMTCGDLVPAVCCFPATSCKGPDFVCCHPNDSQSPPTCVNGWRTCSDGTSPAKTSCPGG